MTARPWTSAHSRALGGFNSQPTAERQDDQNQQSRDSAEDSAELTTVRQRRRLGPAVGGVRHWQQQSGMTVGGAIAIDPVALNYILGDRLLRRPT